MIDLTITVAVMWIFLYWAPTRIGDYFSSCNKSTPLVIESDDIPLWYEEGLNFDIEEIEDTSMYIDDFDVYDYKK